MLNLSVVNRQGDSVGTVEIDPAEFGGHINRQLLHDVVLMYLANQIVDDREAVVVDTGETRHGIKLSLRVAPEDMGKVIGRRGRVAQSIRSVVRAAGAKDGVDVLVDIVD